ncbi:hypothetical protein FB567DRAFT_625914 [Paraphoma chrysanthemicola]|uniref:Uncharacterized protein n=1 Tax=Paraphoma chrysanthemicola TaxID=798071 RepID=A0A8K0RCH2_9PLEO|nr:hypothetical protein FB567DRAFT_625914 [Paraphoma chrysanthemicola]
MKVVHVPTVAQDALPIFLQSNTNTAPDNRLENAELVCIFRELADMATGLSEYSNSFAPPSLLPLSTDVDEPAEDASNVFQSIAAAGLAVINQPDHQFWGPLTKTAGTLLQAFADISRAGLAYLNTEYDHFPLLVILDHDTHIPRAALLLSSYSDYIPIDDWYFFVMAAACIRYQTYENDYDLLGEELQEFRAMADAVIGYQMHTADILSGWIRLDWPSMNMLVTKDVPIAVVQMSLTKRLRDAPRTFLEFREMSEGLTNACAYELPPKFQCYLQLPAELRALVIHEYLLLEQQAGRLSTHRHDAEYGNGCCVWEYPNTLIACDNQDPTTIPAPETGRTPQGWLPTLAFTSKPMLGELTVHMLRGTERFDLKYIKNGDSFKIATWLRQFITAIPGDDGVMAVNAYNPSVELMVACKNLRKVDMTFHASSLRKSGPAGGKVPKTAQELAGYYHLHPIFDCENLQEVHFDGIYRPPRFGGDPEHLISLDRLARWIKKGFLVRRNQVVRVEVVRR